MFFKKKTDVSLKSEIPEKAGVDVSRRKFLSKALEASAGVGGILLGLGATTALVNIENIEDEFDKRKSADLDKEIEAGYEKVKALITRLNQKYDIDIVIKDLSKASILWRENRIKYNSLKKDGEVLQTNLSDFFENVQKKLLELDNAMSIWPKAILRSIKKIRFTGLLEQGDYDGSVASDKVDFLNLHQGQQIELSLNALFMSQLFPHEMTHLSEKFFTGRPDGLNYIWQEAMHALSVPVIYEETRNKTKLKSVSRDQLVAHGFASNYSASFPEEDRANVVGSIFDPVGFEYRNFLKDVDDVSKKVFEVSFEKKKKFMKAMLHVFSFGQMSDSFFAVIDQPEKNGLENLKNTQQEVKFLISSPYENYESYQEGCKKVLRDALGVSDLPPGISKFLSDLFSQNLRTHPLSFPSPQQQRNESQYNHLTAR